MGKNTPDMGVDKWMHYVSKETRLMFASVEHSPEEECIGCGTR